MKRLLLPVLIAFSFLLNSAILKAQPTVTAANVGFLPGQEFVVAKNGANYNHFLSPQTGANQVWNFSIAGSSIYDTIRILSRSQAPFQTVAPNANTVVYSTNYNYNDYSEFRFLEISTSKLTRKGSKTPNFAHVVENIETPDVLRFPFTFNNNFIDTASSQYPGANNITCTYKEVYTVEAVGYGQLITPVATYNQALQVRTTRESLSDNCRPQMYRGYSTDIIYDWYVPGIHTSVYQLTEHTVSLGQYYTGYYLHSAMLNLKEDLANQINLQTFPNPATSEVTIQYALKSASEVRLVLTDALGREVMKQTSAKQSAGNRSQKLDVSKLPKGVYLVRLETQAGVAVRKLLIQ